MQTVGMHSQRRCMCTYSETAIIKCHRKLCKSQNISYLVIGPLEVTVHYTLHFPHKSPGSISLNHRFLFNSLKRLGFLLIFLYNNTVVLLTYWVFEKQPNLSHTLFLPTFLCRFVGERLFLITLNCCCPCDYICQLNKEGLHTGARIHILYVFYHHY